MKKTADLTPDEERNVRTALKFLYQRCGAWEPLSKALGTSSDMLSRITCGMRPVPARLVFRVARFAKVGVDDVLTGRFPPEGTCPNCGYCPGKVLQ